MNAAAMAPAAAAPPRESIIYRFLLEYVDSQNSECAQRPAPYVVWVNSANVGPSDNIKRFKASFATASTRFQKDNSLKDYGLSVHLATLVHGSGMKMTVLSFVSSDFITSSMVKKVFAAAAAGGGGSSSECRLTVPAYTHGGEQLTMEVTFVEIATERYVQSVQLSMALEVYELVATRQKLGSFTSIADFGSAMCKDAGVDE